MTPELLNLYATAAMFTATVAWLSIAIPVVCLAFVGYCTYVAFK